MTESSGRKPLVVALFGPTAVGKSRVAVELARICGGEIVSADSMQVYRGLPILTDQPDEAMLSAVPHHFIGSVGIDEDYSAARFASEADALIEEISERGKLPLLVGGTGLYIRSLLGGFSFAGPSDPEARYRWQEFIRTEGLDKAFMELQQLDQEAAASIDRENPRRLLRALEGAEAAASGRGRSVSEERQRLWSSASPYRVRSFGLTAPRDDIYRLIEDRVDAMLAAGAVEEVRAARRAKVSRTASQAIGFREICKYLDGLISLEDVAAAIKQKSRRYAKRQLTWMRKMPDIVRIDVAGSSTASVAQAIIDRIDDRTD
ncbi:MAG: tRNA (adenosine(37)-N6)-dimethylallyltransferase MiaA [Actinobacteria bacterium]|nr:tRNA (adenosine(37)-N6)-dimethylallyltransferase MiaA [Actinomycetota bacterium]MCL5882370.1 tRNA (adenosine(37)-N6)-dimethylallyltransferase MiaA [Actinomycetota bacterium]